MTRAESGSVSPRPQSPNADRPERSRNAKAQARHRAKRKAYIEQLEQTVTKLQTALALSPDQVAALPPPSARIRQLEIENNALRVELEDLRRQLHLFQQHQPLAMPRRASILANEPHFDLGRRDSYVEDFPRLKRRRTSMEEPYLSPDQTPSPPAQPAYARTSHYSSPIPQQPAFLSNPGTASASPVMTTASLSATSTPSLLSGSVSYNLPSMNAHQSHQQSSAVNYSSSSGFDALSSLSHAPLSMAPTSATQQALSSRVSLGSTGSSSPGFSGSLYDTSATSQNGMPVKLEDDASYLASTQGQLTGFTFSQPTDLGAWQSQPHPFSAGRPQIHA